MPFISIQYMWSSRVWAWWDDELFITVIVLSKSNINSSLGYSWLHNNFGIDNVFVDFGWQSSSWSVGVTSSKFPLCLKKEKKTYQKKSSLFFSSQVWLIDWFIYLPDLTI